MGQIQRLTRGQVKPYNSLPRIDWSHPLAAGLATYCYDIGGSIVDLVNGGGQIKTFNTSGSQQSQFGRGLQIPLTGWAIMPALSAGKINPLGGAAPYTAAMGTFNLGLASATEAVVVSVQDSANTENTVFGFNTFSSNVVAGEFGNAATSNFIQNLVVGGFQSWLIAADTGTTCTFYSNGVFDKRLTGQATTFSGVTAPQIAYSTARTDGTQDFGGGINGFVFYYAGWARELSTGEALLLHQDPYCFLIYPEEEMLATLVGAGTVIIPPPATGLIGTASAEW